MEFDGTRASDNNVSGFGQRVKNRVQGNHSTNPGHSEDPPESKNGEKGSGPCDVAARAAQEKP